MLSSHLCLGLPSGLLQVSYKVIGTVPNVIGSGRKVQGCWINEMLT
jgi:hypothetical protein